MKLINYMMLAVMMLSFLLPTASHAQSLSGQALADSLFEELSKTKHDTDRALLLYRLSKALVTVDVDEAALYADSCMHVSKKNNFSKGIGYAYTNMTRVCIVKSDYSAALENSNKAYDVFTGIGFKPGIGDALLLSGIAYERQGYYAKSIENNYAALKLYEETGVRTNMASVYNNLGNSYFALNDFSSAVKNYSKALELHRAAGNKYSIGLVLDNISSAYKKLGEYEKADEYNAGSIKIFEEMGIGALSSVYFNRGLLMEGQKDYKAAFEFYNKAMGISKKFNLKSSLAHDYAGLAGLYLSVAKKDTVKTIPEPLKINKAALLQKANMYYTQALNYSTENGELLGMMDYNKGLSETEYLRGDYKASLDYYKQFTTYQDSIYNDETKDEIAALEKQRLADVKDAEIKLLNKDKALQASEIKRQTLIRNIIIAAVAIAGILAFFFMRSFNRRRKITFDKQVLQTEMKALRAQMNPHFIFNSLHSINKYIIENDKENASEYLSRFATLMRLVLENSREQEVPLENDLAALELYMQLESLRFQNSFEYHIQVEAGIDPENTLIPPLLLQPFAENAIIHGIQHKEGGVIQINISTAENNMIRCTVEDNGKGITVQPLVEQEKVSTRKSLGMKIMQERLNVINQLKKVKAAVHIFDLKDANNQPGGLRVELLLPLQLAF